MCCCLMEPSHGGSREHAFLREIHSASFLHHRALRFQHTPGTRLAFTSDLLTCASPMHSEYLRINVYVHYDYVLHFPVDLALQITFKTNDPDTDKVSRYSSLLRFTFACFLAYCLSHYTWINLTLDVQSKDFIVSAICKRTRRQVTGSLYLPRGVRHLKDYINFKTYALLLVTKTLRSLTRSWSPSSTTTPHKQPPQLMPVPNYATPNFLSPLQLSAYRRSQSGWQGQTRGLSNLTQATEKQF